MKTISTQKVNCKDCHRCVRSCLVKAIAIKKGHAQLVDEKCVLCGKCVVECPQHAKQVENQTELIQSAIGSGRKVVLSLAPAFAAAFPEYTSDQLIAAIQAIGFHAVEETAIGAEIVADYYRSFFETSDRTVISACCPVVVSLITKYYPELIQNLAPVVSPMLAHGNIMRERYGDCFIVFAGPCIAKIEEARSPNSDIDAVITFEQLRVWLKQVQPTESPVAFAREAHYTARLFPITGGILRTAFEDKPCSDTEIIAVDGLRQCMAVFDSLLKGEIKPRFVEALSCTGGCINGPASGSRQSIPAKRFRVVAFMEKGRRKRTNVARGPQFMRKHQANPITHVMPTEEQIREIMHQTGKFNKSDEKNCGACGYDSCRDNAIAVFEGLTEIDTCVPYMRTKAESFANIVVDNSLNAIILMNEKLVIQEFNPTAERMFNRRQELTKGISLTEIMDCTDVLAAIQAGRKVAGRRVEFPKYDLVVEEMIVPVPEHGMVFLIFSDVTAQEKRSRELDQMKLDTVEKAKEIINKQMHVAQEIAGLLGETTAETKSALLELITIMREKGAR